MPLKPLTPAGQNWRTINDLAAAQSRHRRESVAFNHLLSPELRGRELSRGRAHPFQIYQVYSVPEAPSTDWRTFRVRSGRVCLLTADGFLPDGTDEAHDPYGEVDPLHNEDLDEYVVPSGEGFHWFWITLTIPDSGEITGEISHSSTPEDEGWDSFPDFDGKHIPIGYVDTSTHAADKVADVFQLLTVHWLFCGLEMCLDQTEGETTTEHTYIIPAFQRDDPA
jgi:hypothetical protein